MPIELHQAAPGPHRHDTALQPCADGIQVWPVGKIIPPGPQGQAAGTDGKAALTVHLDDNKVDGGAYHILHHKLRPLPALLPHLCGGNHDANPVGHHNGAVHGLLFHFPGLRIPHPDRVGVDADDGSSQGAAAAIGGVDGVPFLPFIRR